MVELDMKQLDAWATEARQIKLEKGFQIYTRDTQSTIPLIPVPFINTQLIMIIGEINEIVDDINKQNLGHVGSEFADACIRLIEFLKGCHGEYFPHITLQYTYSTTLACTDLTENPIQIVSELMNVIREIALYDPIDKYYELGCLFYALEMIMTIATDLGIDIKKEIENKMAFNRTRPAKHGNKQFN